jgi:hypothetical protein
MLGWSGASGAALYHNGGHVSERLVRHRISERLYCCEGTCDTFPGSCV